jgi:hypothetical protein
MVCHRDRLGETFRFIVNAARADRVHVSPVILFLRMLERIAVNFRGRRENEHGFFILGQPKRVVRAERADFERGDR